MTTPAKALYDALGASESAISVGGSDVLLKNVVTRCGFESGMAKADINAGKSADGKPKDLVRVSLSDMTAVRGDTSAIERWQATLSVDVESQTSSGRVLKLLGWISRWGAANKRGDDWFSLQEQSCTVDLGEERTAVAVGAITFGVLLPYEKAHHPFD